MSQECVQWFRSVQVAEELGPDKVQVLKIDTDQNPEISTQLQVKTAVLLFSY